MSVVPPPGSLTVGGDNRSVHLEEPNEVSVIPPSPPIPHAYHENRIVFLVRDPTTLFASWELTPEAISEVHSQLGSHAPHTLTLRILELKGTEHASILGEYDVGGAHSWYIYHDRPGSVCQAQLGIKCEDQFIPIVQSAPVHTPTGRESDWVDAEWATIEEVLERSRKGQYRGASFFV